MSGENKITVFGGLGGLICGIDFGIIAVAVPYIRALGLYSDSEIGWIVGGVMLGGIIASVCGGFLCDRLGRRSVVRLAAACFLLSIPVICLSGTSFPVIIAGRILQGLSCGFLSVAVPLYLAETLPAERRGKGTAVFQLFLGIGLVLAALAGVVIARTLGAADAGSDAVSAGAKSLAWRVNFWWTMLPGALLAASSFSVPESAGRAAAPSAGEARAADGEPLCSRRFVLPFLLALAVLTLNKLIGFGCVIPYAVMLLQKAGLSGALGNMGDLAVKVTNLVTTLAVVGLVDRLGRTRLMKIGTAGLTVALGLIGALFLAFERGWLAASPAAGAATLGAFVLLVFSYSFGPGVCVWLVLSELMPVRIRAKGMSVALLSNQFVAWGLASAFLPLANAVGFGPLFFGFALFGALYFATALFIPETKGLTMDEIETLFEKDRR
jgi:MFS family permease